MEKPLKKKICPQNFLLPISFLQYIFASQYSFLPPNDFLLAKNSPKILLAKLPPQKNLLLQNKLHKISSQENFFKKNCSPFCSPNFHPNEFAPQIFPPKNLLSNIFALHISSDNEFYLQKFLQNIFTGEISSSQESLLQNLVPKISSQENLL